MRRTLRPYQAKALEWLLERKQSALFMDLRLGKTLTTLRYRELVDAPRTLVVAPAPVLLPWKVECEEEGVPYFEVRGTHTKRVEICRADVRGGGVWLIGYEALRATPDVALNCEWDLVVLDESTRIKNPKAKITKLCQLGFRDVPFRLILSGLPNPESDTDYFSQFAFLHGGFMGQKNYWRWLAEHFQQVDYDWYPRQGARAKIATAVAKDAYILSRKDIGANIGMVFEKRAIPMVRKQQEAYDRARDEFEWINQDGEKMRTTVAAVRFSWMQRVSGGFLPDETLEWSGKVNEAVDLLRGELAKEKVVVWAHFNAELKEMAKRTPNSELIFGETPKKRREEILRQFRKSSRPRVLFVQEALGKFGLNLSSSDTQIYFSNAFSLEERRQSLDRITDYSKSHAPLTIDLMSEDSADEIVLDALAAKNTTSAFMTRRIRQQQQRQKEKLQR